MVARRTPDGEGDGTMGLSVSPGLRQTIAAAVAE